MHTFPSLNAILYKEPMKKILLFLMTWTLAVSVHSQDKTQLPYQSIFVELGGPGLPYSFNYDFRFNKEKMDSWGLRVGASGYAVSGSQSFFSLPLMANRLYGKGPHYFELGFGFTFFAFSNQCDDYYCVDGYFDQNTGQYVCTNYGGDDYSFILDVDGSPSLMGTMNFGYRRIPVDGGFTWKISLNPIFNNNGFWPLYAGVGLGYAF